MTDQGRAVAPLPAPPRLLPVGWPLTVLLVGYPVLWALGLAAFATQVVAVPMAVDLLRRRSVRVPRGFGLWLAFLVCSLLGLITLGVNPPNTLPDSSTGRLIGFLTRETGYLAITVVFVWVGNLSERELPSARINRQLGIFFVAVTVGGVLGLTFPHTSFTSPLELLLPHDIASNSYVSHLVHPAFAQVQDLGGKGIPRPSAPFAYTNTWGSQISLLAVWFVLAWVVLGSRTSRALAPVVLLVAMVAVVFSVNRGVWIGVAVSLVYVGFVLARRGRTVLVAAAMLAVVGAGVIVVETPLGAPLTGVVQTRAENGKSNSVRAFTAERAIELGKQSPLIGYGMTRNAVGSASSITIGKSSGCANCGNIAIGINGTFFTLVVTTGFLGAGLFFAFGLVQAWQSRRDRSAVAVAAQLTLVLTVLYSFFYTVELVVPFLALALLWRRRANRGEPDSDAEVEAEHKGPEPAAQPSPG